MRRLVLVATLVGWGLVVGCATKPAQPKPTALDVAHFKQATWIAGQEAILNAPWSKQQAETIAKETSDRVHHLDQLAEAAEIDTNVPWISIEPLPAWLVGGK